MKPCIPLMILPLLLASCGEDTTTPRIGQPASVHDYYSATVTSYSVAEIANGQKSDGTTETFQRNDYRYVILGITVCGNQSDKAHHILDQDDFKLAENTRIDSLRKKPIPDYRWIGLEIGPSTKENITLAFEVTVRSLDTYQYLEIDFTRAPGNAFIKLTDPISD